MKRHVIWKWLGWVGFALPSDTRPRVAVAVAVALAGLAGPQRQGPQRQGLGRWCAANLQRLPIGLHAAGGAAIKKERPQRTAKSEANKRPVDRKVAWSWFGCLTSQRRTLSLPTDPQPMRLPSSSLSLCLPACPPARPPVCRP